jgi:hypothetical protein
MALALAALQVDAPCRAAASRGLARWAGVYLTDHYGAARRGAAGRLQQRWPGVHWVGSVGVGVWPQGVEYIDEPALVLMLGPARGSFRVFSGARKLHRIEAYSALVHADPATPDLDDLLAEMSDRTTSGYLFGGLASSRGGLHMADGVWQGRPVGRGLHAGRGPGLACHPGLPAAGPHARSPPAERNVSRRSTASPRWPAAGRPGHENLADPRRPCAALRATLVG